MHPEIQGLRKLQDKWDEEEDEDGLPPLVPPGDPDQGGGELRADIPNNGFRSSGLTRVVFSDPASGTIFNLAELIAMYAAGQIPGQETSPGVGQDLCYFAFQALPPPPSVPASDSIIRVVDGVEQEFYNYPVSDMPRGIDLCTLGATKFQSFIADPAQPYGDVVQFGACTFGAEASKAFCELNITSPEGSMCDPARTGSPVAWPQAIIMFKIAPDNIEGVTGLLDKWRNEVHLPNMHWVFAGGSGAVAGEDLLPANYAGWGANGALRAKVVQCDKINPELIKPLGPNGDYMYGADAFSSADSNVLMSSIALEEFNRLCGIPFFNEGEDVGCTIDADAPDVEQETHPIREALLPFDEQCSYTTTYVSASTVCGQGLNDAWGNQSIAENHEQMLDEGWHTCGQEFCTGLSFAPSSDEFGIDDNGFFFCGDGFQGPTNCEEGTEYMEALSQWVECTLTVRDTVSKQRELDSLALTSKARSAASSQACETVVSCDDLVVASVTNDWRTRFCVNFFAALRDPTIHPDDSYAWVEGCGYSGDGSSESLMWQTCEGVFEVETEEDATSNARSLSFWTASVLGFALAFLV